MIRSLVAVACLAAPAFAGPRTDIYGDPLPEGAIARFGTVRYRLGPIGPYALSPDGKTLAVEGPTAVTLWDVDTGKPGLRIPFSGHQTRVPQTGFLLFTADRQSLVRVLHKDVRVFDTKTGRQRVLIELPEGGLELSPVPGTSRFLVVDVARGAHVYDAATGRRVSSVTCEANPARLTPSGRSILGLNDSRTVLADADTGKIRVQFEETRELPESEDAVSPDDRRLYAVGRDGRLMTFDTSSAKLLENLDAPAGLAKPRGAVGLALSPDGTVAYLWRESGPVQRRDLKAGKWLDPLPETGAGRLVPHPDGKRVLFVGSDGVLRRYDLATLKELPPPDGFEDAVLAVPSPDGRRVFAVSGSRGTRLDLFDAAGRLKWSRSVKTTDLKAPYWSPDGRQLVWFERHGIVVHDAAPGQADRVLAVPAGSYGGDLTASFNADRTRLVLGYGLGVSVFDLTTGKIVGGGSNDEHGGAPAISPDAATMAVGSLGRGVCLVDVATGKVRVPWTDPPRDCKAFKTTNVLFSPDGSFLLDWDENGVAVLRDPVSGDRKRTINTGYTYVRAFDLTPDGLWLATGSPDGLVALWDVATGRQVWAEHGHWAPVIRVGFAGPGRLVSTGRDLTALLWDLKADKKPAKPLWEALSGGDGLAAYQAVWALAADPAGPELLRGKVMPAKHPPAEAVRGWIKDLGADKFAVREAAAKSLRDLGRPVEADLRAARDSTTAEEVRTRLDGLLANLPRERTPAEVVHARAVAALELAGTDAAKKLLAEWAAGADGARLTIDAKAALGRLEARR
jgi:WD40 repeat protein